MTIGKEHKCTLLALQFAAFRKIANDINIDTTLEKEGNSSEINGKR